MRRLDKETREGVELVAGGIMMAVWAFTLLWVVPILVEAIKALL